MQDPRDRPYRTRCLTTGKRLTVERGSKLRDYEMGHGLMTARSVVRVTAPCMDLRTLESFLPAIEKSTFPWGSIWVNFSRANMS
jgi:hypothetical protein